MCQNSPVSKFFLIFSFALPLLFAAGCAEVRLNTIPALPPTAKLRVFVIPVSGERPSGLWGMPHEEWARRHLSSVRRFLRETGIYEVTTEEELASVVEKKTFLSGDWGRKNRSLVRQVGQALHADYAMVIERSIIGVIVYNEMVIINMETGKRFKALVSVRGDSDKKDSTPIRVAYNEIFRNAKSDMLATAIRKGRLAAPEFFTVQSPILPPPSAKPVPTPLLPSSTVAKAAAKEKPATTARPEPPQKPPTPSLATPKPAPPEKPLVAKAEPVKKAPPEVVRPPVPAVPKMTEPVSAKPAVPPAPRPEEKPSAPQEITKEVNYEEVISAEAAAKGGANLAVYDLDTIEPYRVVALILSEALRQELFKLGLFHLVNRENIVKVLEEMALQQTGLVDEKEAARAGRGLAAQQIVLGRFGILGKNSIVQAKRVDVETQGTLGLGTLRCDVGREDELLQHMTELAREIAKKK